MWNVLHVPRLITFIVIQGLFAYQAHITKNFEFVRMVLEMVSEIS